MLCARWTQIGFVAVNMDKVTLSLRDPDARARLNGVMSNDTFDTVLRIQDLMAARNDPVVTSQRTGPSVYVQSQTSGYCGICGEYPAKYVRTFQTTFRASGRVWGVVYPLRAWL